MKPFYIILLILDLIQPYFTQIISVPFKFKPIERRYLSYRTKTFFEEYFNNKLILELNIGTPLSKVDCILNTESSCFIFTKIKSSYVFIKNNYYNPNISSSFQLIKGNSKKLKNAQDLFFFNDTKDELKINFLIKKENISEIDTNLKKYLYFPELGINLPQINSQKEMSCPNFLDDLKNKKIINKNIFSIIYNINNNTNEEGKIIFGEDLDLYDNKYSHFENYKINFIDKNIFELNSIYVNEKKGSEMIHSNVTNNYQKEKKERL